jgi:MFS family permease
MAEPAERLSARPARPSRLGALACPPFARLLSGQVVSQVGTQMNNTAAAWVLYRLTHSAQALGLQGLCFSVPIAVLPLLTGMLADRSSRLALVKATLAAEAAQAFALAALAGTGNLRPWMLYLAAGADACRLAVGIPAQSALIPNVVPPAVLLSAVALSSSTWSSAATVGPALAGALLTVSGPGLVFAVNGACTLAALGAVSTLGRVARRPVTAATGRPGHPGGLGASVAYLRSHRTVLWLEGILLVAMAAVLGVETLLPVFASQSWNSGSAGYGLLRIAPGVGAVLAGLGLSMFPPAGRRILVLSVAFAGAGAALTAFAAGPPFAVALILLTGGSWCLAATQVIAGTMVQQATPDALRGRISALGSAGQSGVAGVAAALTATAADVIGGGRAVGALAAVSVGAGLLCCAGLAQASRSGARRPRAVRRWFSRVGRTGTRR